MLLCLVCLITIISTLTARVYSSQIKSVLLIEVLPSFKAIMYVYLGSELRNVHNETTPNRATNNESTVLSLHNYMIVCAC